MLRRSLVALPALRDFDVWAAVKANKLDRLETWIHVSASYSTSVQHRAGSLIPHIPPSAPP